MQPRTLLTIISALLLVLGITAGAPIFAASLYRNVALVSLVRVIEQPPISAVEPRFHVDAELAERTNALRRSRALAFGSLSLVPDDPRARRVLGWIAIAENRNDEAISYFTPTGSGTAPNAVDQIWLGLASSAEGRHDEAIANWWNAQAYWLLQRWYTKQGLTAMDRRNYPAAIASFQGLVVASEAKQDKYWIRQGHEWLGHAYWNNGQPDQASESWQAALR